MYGDSKALGSSNTLSTDNRLTLKVLSYREYIIGLRKQDSGRQQEEMFCIVTRRSTILFFCSVFVLRQPQK